MRIQLDHIVLFVDDLDRAVEDFRSFGFHTVYGGSHPQWGTYNALIYFESCYIELIAIEHEEIFQQASKEPYTLHETYAQNGRANGLTRLALRTDVSDLAAVQLQNANFKVFGPDNFSRQTKTGELIHWKLVHIGDAERKALLPFLIHWDTPDEARFSGLRAQGVIAAHPVGDIKVSSIHLSNGDLKQLAQFYDVLEVPYSKDEQVLIVNLGEIQIHYHNEPDQLAKLVFSGAQHESILYENTILSFE